MSTATAEAGLTVQTSEGPVRGRAAGGTRFWRGIPYAAPPVGELRLRMPRRARPWHEVLDASAFGAWAPQRLPRMLPGTGPRIRTSEDCLTLNVTVPAAPAEGPLPVLVFIHGGAFSSGSGALDMTGESSIVSAGNVVFVSMNYRLGALGFMDFRAYSTAERTFDANVGLGDQIAALEWVQRNIAAFGGDPENVTVFGDAAGATAALTLMCVPAAAGLFHRAFLQSPAAASVYGAELAGAWAADVLGLLGVGAGGAAETLSELPEAALAAAANQLAVRVVPDTRPGARCPAPVVDGSFLPLHPLDAFRQGSAHRLPVVIGTMESEGLRFEKVHDILPATPERVEKMFALTEPELLDAVAAAYRGYPKKKQAAEIGADAVFWHPAIQLAQSHSGYAPTWSYRFDYTPGAGGAGGLGGLGGSRGPDVPAVSGNYGFGVGRALLRPGNRRTATNLGHRFQSALLRFARTGAPGPMWPKYDTTSRRTKIFDQYDRIELDPRRDLRKAWDGYRGYR